MELFSLTTSNEVKQSMKKYNVVAVVNTPQRPGIRRITNDPPPNYKNAIAMLFLTC